MENSVVPDQTAPMGAVCSGSTPFASLLNSSVMLGNNLQQTTSADHFFRCIFFLGSLRDKWTCYKQNSILLLLVSVADEQPGLNIVANSKTSFLTTRPILIGVNLLWETPSCPTKGVTIQNGWNNRISYGCVYAQIRSGLGMHLVTCSNHVFPKGSIKVEV